jgi:hypothetical protein
VGSRGSCGFKRDEPEGMRGNGERTGQDGGTGRGERGEAGRYSDYTSR